MQSKSIVAVVVTHNRLPDLKQVLSGISRQTLLPSHVVVVNNESSDGTRDWLEDQTQIIAIHQENTGGAGGFRTGVEKGMSLNADWLWLLDDDVLPAEDCLEKLLSYSELSQCIQPVRLGEHKVMLDEERFLDVNSCRICTSQNISFKNGKRFVFTNIGCFEGMLIAVPLVRKIGLPDARFFLAHDDLVFGYLASKFTNIIVTQDAVLQKLPSSFSRYDSYRYLYYSIRNIWLVHDYLSKDFAQTTRYRSRKIKQLFLTTARSILTTSNYQNKWKAFRILNKAYKDFRLKKTGKGNIDL
jgi:rhamnopyranosyl-N-acetylglucosaminyl-diphospho-decaprenol beta-1,3/1,4-galactofuranosyltransferase